MPLSPDEQKQLQLLLAKANGLSVDGVDDPSPSEDFEFVKDQTGAMSDASKRREDMPDLHRDHKKPMTYSMSVHDAPSGSATPWNMSEGVPATMIEFHQPTMNDASVNIKKNGKLIEVKLPPGVPNSTVWGRTVITFGAFKDSGLCYEELYESEDPRAITYVKWCKGRVTSADAALLDLAQYLCFKDELRRGFSTTAGPMIPGTESCRMYK